jgi:hypothetical protein
VPSDDLRQRFEALETDVLPLTGPPATEAIRRRGRRRQRTILVAVLLSAVLLGAVAARGAAKWAGESNLEPVSPPPTTGQAVVTPTSTVPATSTTGSIATNPPTTGIPQRPTTTVVLRADGLGVVPFGSAERDAMSALQGRLGPPAERRSWSGATPFGTCPGPVKAVRWGRLYALFTDGPTRYASDGRWHLFAWQVDSVQRSKVDPQYSGPTPPTAPPLRGYSPRTTAGIGVGSTVAELRAASGSSLNISFGTPGNTYWFRVGQGAAGELSGSLSGGTPRATVTVLDSGAVCGE